MGADDVLALLCDGSLEPAAVAGQLEAASAEEVARARKLLAGLEGAPGAVSVQISDLPESLALALTRAAALGPHRDLLRELALCPRPALAAAAKRELHAAPDASPGALSAMRSTLAPAEGKYRSLEHFAWRNPGLLSLVVIAICSVLAALTLPHDRSLHLYMFGAKSNDDIASGEWWRLLTCAFLHGGWEHLAFNAYALFVVGSFVESAYGRVRFVAIYVLSALGGSLASYALVKSPSVGASGAIFGLVGAGMLSFWRGERETVAALGPKQLVFLGLWAAQSLMAGFKPDSGIDNAAHVGGLATGLAVAMIPDGKAMRALAGVAVAAVLTAWGFDARFAARFGIVQRAAGLRHAGDLDGADRELTLAGDFPRALTIRALIRLTRADYNGALAFADSAIRGSRGDVRCSALVMRAGSLAGLGRTEEGLAAAEEAMQSESPEIREAAKGVRDAIREGQAGGRSPIRKP